MELLEVNGMVPDIVCYEQGTEELKPWVGTVQALGTDLDALQSLHEQKIIRLTRSRSTVVVQGRSRVGHVLLPSGRHLVLKTKIPGLVLVDWLVYLNEIPALEAWQRDALLKVEGSLERCIAILFIQATERMTRVHMAKGFVKQDIAATQVRGRIRASAMAEQMWRLPRLPQTIRTRSFDIAANQVIALALDRLKRLRLELPKEVQKQFAALNDSWSMVERSRFDLRELINLSLYCPPAGYRTALTLARFILLGAHLDPIAGSGGTIFTLSLARVWEKSLEKLCRDIQDETGWRVQSRRHCVQSWHDVTGQDDPKRQLIVDVLLRKGATRKILDAKYKCDYGQESRVDRFQMCAYALAFNAQNVVLVYPSDRGQHDPYRVLLQHEASGSLFRIGSMFLSMPDGPTICRIQLQNVLMCELS